MEKASSLRGDEAGSGHKSALLQKLHHRVRNNLQTVASLLSLQLRHTKGRSARLPLEESVCRIQSIPRVHNLLLQRDLVSTTVAEIARQIVDLALVNLPHPKNRGSRYSFDGPPLIVPSAQATILALVLMSSCTTRFVHGFNDHPEVTWRSGRRRTTVLARVEILRTTDGPCRRGSDRGQRRAWGCGSCRPLCSADLKGSSCSTEATARQPRSHFRCAE